MEKKKRKRKHEIKAESGDTTKLMVLSRKSAHAEFTSQQGKSLDDKSKHLQ